MIKDKILKYIEKKSYLALDAKTLFSKFEEISFDNFNHALKELEDDYLIIINKKNKILSAKKSGIAVGEVTGVRSDFIFVKLEGLERDIRMQVNNGEMKNIRFLDKILIKDDGKEYKFEKIISHKINNIVGEYKVTVQNGKKASVLVPDNKNFQVSYDISEDDSANLVPGHKVVFTLIDSERGPSVKLTKIIGHKNDPGVDIETKVIESGAPTTFDERTLKEVEGLPSSVKKEDFPDRLDLTDKLIFTIDGADAKDLDDAVDCYKLDNGNFKLGVHISDVAHYATENSALDIEAEKRGTSIYLTDRVVPMYPHKLSNGICSLNPDVNRLTMTCYMEINKKGEILSHSIHESIINSKKRFTYKEVNEILENNNEHVISKNEEFVPMLRDLQELSHILRKRRDDRGQIELDIPESKIILDDTGYPIDIQIRNRGEGEKLIEDCMIAANESVAESISLLKLPSLYRTHDTPDPEKIEYFSKIAKAMGIKLRYNQTMPLNTYLSSVLALAKNEIQKEVLATLFLRSLPKAIYSPNNAGHFGLASKNYTHFTAPIRRYPDTLINRILKKYIINQEYLNDDFNEELFLEKLKIHGETTSMQERRAIQLERDVDDMKKAEYMENKIGETYTGKVSGFIDKGIFLRLPNTVEGFINFNDLGDDYYNFNKDRFLVEGVMSKKTIKIGESMKIIVAGASKENGKIDFKPISDGKKKSKYNKKRRRR